MRALRLLAAALAFLLVPCKADAQLLKLPPGGIQVLEINRESSYFGDAVRVVNCQDDKDNPLGTCGDYLFGGLALAQSHLTGRVQMRFFPPVEGISHFEITHPGNLRGEDTVMKAPLLYQLPVNQNFIIDPFGEVSSGDLNLNTGEVLNVKYKVIFSNSFYNALASVNPNLRAGAFLFPGTVGTTKIEFEQRSDGRLDFTLRASTFLPLGKYQRQDITRIPLPFCGPLIQCAGLPAPGSSLHPHVQISTKAPEGTPCGSNCPDLPSNTIQKYTVYTPLSTVGDAFHLNIPELGGPATGRAHLTGRIQIQFGVRSGDYVPVAITALGPEGLLADPPVAPPIPGMYLGLLGHDTELDFPTQSGYGFKEVITADDPFDLAVGAVNLKTGQILGDMVVRELLSQVVLQAVVRLNPGLPQATFRFHGPALFEKGVNGQTVFRFNGELVVPFSGFVYPRPDLVTGWVTGPDSFLDLFYRVQAMNPPLGSGIVLSGSASDALSVTGDRFSYRYSIPCSDTNGESAVFEYTNNNSKKGGTFKMHSLAAVSCINSRTSNLPNGSYDTVSFTGYGTWSGDSNLHAATVVISTSAVSPMVAVKIDAGLVSDASTRARQSEPLP